MLLYSHYPVEPRTRRAAQALASAGHAVTVLCLQGESELSQELVGGVEVLRVLAPRIDSSVGPLLRKIRTARAVRGVRTAWRAAIEGRVFDVVHAHNLDTLAPAFGIAASAGARVVYDAHELWVEYVADRGPGLRERIAALPVRVYWTAVERRLLPRVDAAITVNEFIAAEMARRYRCPVPEVVLNVAEAPPSGIEPLPVVMPGLSVIYQGALSLGRGLPELLEAVARTPEVNLTIMGAGVLDAALRARAAQPDLIGRVVVLDPVAPQRVVPIARSADVGVIPFQPTTLNNRLASPNKLFEYMHAGLAIISTDLPFIRWVLDETGAGLTVPPGDIDGWASRLRELAADPALLARLRECSAVSASRFTWDTEKQKLLAIYERLEIGAAR